MAAPWILVVFLTGIDGSTPAVENVAYYPTYEKCGKAYLAMRDNLLSANTPGLLPGQNVEIMCVPDGE